MSNTIYGRVGTTDVDAAWRHMNRAARGRAITLGPGYHAPFREPFDEHPGELGVEFDIASRDLLEPGDDWAPGGVEFSPLEAKRFAVLVGWIEDVLSEPTVTSLQLDLTDGYQPDGVVALRFADAPARIMADLLRESPPCLRYVITRDGPSEVAGGEDSPS